MRRREFDDGFLDVDGLERYAEGMHDDPGLRLDPTRNVVRGQRVEPQLNAAGFILRQSFQLVRAEDRTGHVNLWQVNLSPVWRRATGPTFEGQPSRFAPITGDGAYFAFMTWGGGGVSFRTRFPYPACGSSFAVSGDNVMLDVVSIDIGNVYTEDTKPCIVAWVTPTTMPTSRDPLVETITSGLVQAIAPWARRIVVTKDTIGASVSVAFDGVITAQLQPLDSVLAVPIPNGSITVELVASAGTAFGHQELCFT